MEFLLARVHDLLRPRPSEAEAVGAALRSALEGHPAADDLILRPGVDAGLLGALIRALLDREDVTAPTKARACERLFDAIALPDREDEAFVTAIVVPPGLQEAARFLAAKDAFADYHLLHLVYALYLDPERAAAAPLEVLRTNLETVLDHDASEDLRLLYAYLLLTAPHLEPEDGRALFRTVLARPTLTHGGRADLCRAARDPDAGRAWLVDRARREGLYPPEDVAQEDLLRAVRIRPLPDHLGDVAAAWEASHEEKL